MDVCLYLPSLSLMKTVPDAEFTGEPVTACDKVTVMVKDSTFSTKMSSTILNMIHSSRVMGPVAAVVFENVRKVVSGTKSLPCTAVINQ